MSRVLGLNRFAAALAAVALGLAWAASSPAAAQADRRVQPVSAPTLPVATAPLPQLSSGVAALVNDDVISTYDLRQRALLLIVTAGVPATQENLPQIQQEALRSLVDEHLQMQELRSMEKKQKFAVVADDAEIDRALQQVASDNTNSLNELKVQFAKVGLEMQTLRDQIRVQISWNRMITGLYGSRVRIGDDQINMALQRLKASASRPEYLVSEIFIDASRAGGLTEAMTGARQLITQIQSGAPFGPVARQFSSAPTAANNGDRGWVSSAELAPELAAAVEQMRPGQVSEPIQVSDGVYIVQLREKRSGGGKLTVGLKQAAIRLPADATQDRIDAAHKALEDFKAAGATCADLDAKAKGAGDIVAGDLGESDLTELSPDFRTPAETLGLNQFSEPIRTPVGLHLIMVCSRHETAAKQMNKDEVENRLYNEQLAMLSRRYLRDLRNSATIETP